MRIPLAAPDVDEDDVAAVVATLRSGRLSMGPRLEAFERAAAARLGVADAVGVSSGTAGLHVALRLLGIGEGDEVVTSSFSFAASATTLLYERALPVFADVDPETGCLDPARVEAALTPRTRALLVVHVFGRPAPMAELTAIAARRGIAVIEDACEAFGAATGGRAAGTWGDVGVFAFYPNKQVTTGEGGLVVARDPAALARARRLRNQGRDPAAGWLQHVELGYSYRLSELHAALGASQLARLDAVLARRDELAAAYDERLRGSGAVRVPAPPRPGDRISRFAYVVRLADRFARADRDRVVDAMAARGIECGRYFAPIHLQPALRDVASAHRTPLPETEALADRVIALPFAPSLTTPQVDEVCGSLLGLLARP